MGSRALVSASLLALILTGCGGSGQGQKGPATVAAEQKPVKRLPSFRLQYARGGPFSSEGLRGKVVLLNYWATWCKPCEREMPGLQEIQDRYEGQGVVVVGIAMDADAAAVAAFAKKWKIRFPLLMGTTEVQEELGLLGIPSTFLVDRQGVIRRTIIGFEYEETVDGFLREILQEPPVER